MTTGWKLDRDQRDQLLERFPPRYERTVADHVTLRAREQGFPPAPAVDARIVGRADDGSGVEAFVVEIEGSLDRPDGSTWHITWSLANGRAAQESNDVIADQGFTPVDPVELLLHPATW